MSNFGKNIRYLRKLNNMSQDKLAEKLGYKSFTTIQKWESGNSEPSLKKLNQLSEIFNVDIDELATSDLSKPQEDIIVDEVSISKRFGQRIKKIRESHNMTQEELASKIGFKTKSAISRIEKGERQTDYETLEALSDVFNVDISYLLGKTDKTTILPNNINHLTKEEKQILDPYNQLNPEGQEKAISYTWDLVDSNKYNKDNQTTIPTRQEMISYLSNMEMAAIDGELNIHTMTDENLYSFYKMIKEDDK